MNSAAPIRISLYRITCSYSVPYSSEVLGEKKKKNRLEIIIKKNGCIHSFDFMRNLLTASRTNSSRLLSAALSGTELNKCQLLEQSDFPFFFQQTGAIVF